MFFKVVFFLNVYILYNFCKLNRRKLKRYMISKKIHGLAMFVVIRRSIVYCLNAKEHIALCWSVLDTVHTRAQGAQE